MTTTTAEIPGTPTQQPLPSTTTTTTTASPSPAGSGTPKKRGRPPKNRAAGAPSGAPVAAPSAPPSGSSPYGGGIVSGDGAGAIDLSNAPAAIQQIAALPADQLAKVILTLGQGIGVAVAGMRYGTDIAKRMMPLTKDEKEMLEPLTAEWVKHALPKVTAGELLAVMLIVTIGQKVVTMETALEEQKTKTEARRPSAPPRAEPPPPAPAAT